MKVRQDICMQSSDSSDYFSLMVGQLVSYSQKRNSISSKIFSPTLIRQRTRGKYLFRHQIYMEKWLYQVALLTELTQ
jgi:hypothetical protein